MFRKTAPLLCESLRSLLFSLSHSYARIPPIRCAMHPRHPTKSLSASPACPLRACSPTFAWHAAITRFFQALQSLT